MVHHFNQALAEFCRKRSLLGVTFVCINRYIGQEDQSDWIHPDYIDQEDPTNIQ